VDGENTVDKLALEALIGAVRVLDLTGVEDAITRDELIKAGCAGVERALLKTSNSDLWSQDEFARDFVFLADDGADYLVDQGVVLVGNDYLSIEHFHSRTHYVHETLLKAGIIILEGINLNTVAPGDYELVCLPLKIRDGDGAPARAVLIER
jgi:arylformamidase